jgi:hypothetical protein
MTKSPTTILDTIGNTSLLELRNVVPANGARIPLKLEAHGINRHARARRIFIDAAKRARYSSPYSEL